MHHLKEVFGCTQSHDWNIRRLTPFQIRRQLFYTFQILPFVHWDFKVVPMTFRSSTLCTKMWRNIIKVEHLKRRLTYPRGQERRVKLFFCVWETELQYQAMSLVMQLQAQVNGKEGLQPSASMYLTMSTSFEFHHQWTMCITQTDRLPKQDTSMEDKALACGVSHTCKEWGKEFILLTCNFILLMYTFMGTCEITLLSLNNC